jgi:hypothetical protein
MLSAVVWYANRKIPGMIVHVCRTSYILDYKMNAQ